MAWAIFFLICMKTGLTVLYQKLTTLYNIFPKNVVEGSLILYKKLITNNSCGFQTFSSNVQNITLLMTKFAGNVYLGSTNRPERGDFLKFWKSAPFVANPYIIFQFLIVKLIIVVGKICMSKIGLTVPI